MFNKENKKRHLQIVARAWSDGDYRNRLLSDPNDVLTEAGIELPDNTSIQVLENSSTQRNLIIPFHHSGAVLDEHMLQYTHVRVVERAWSDPEFAKKLSSDPASALMEFDIRVPDGVSLRVAFDEPNTRHFLLPSPPSPDDYADELLKSTGGVINSQGSTF